MMLAEGLEADVPQDHHLLMILVEAPLQDDAGIFRHAAEDLGVHLGDALGRAQDALAGAVLADRLEQIGDSPGYALLVDHARRSARMRRASSRIKSATSRLGRAVSSR